MLIEQYLTNTQIEVLLASILGDGEITKPYKNSRRKNLNYREHSGIEQIEYRKWKMSFFPEFLTFSSKTNTLKSPSHPMITELYPLFYDHTGQKHIPINLIKKYLTTLFLSILYMDDGSLIISKRINKRLKRIYLNPAIALYLQCYKKEELVELANMINEKFDVHFILQKRNDGHKYILRTTKAVDTYKFLNLINNSTKTCVSMYYKTNWNYRLGREKIKLLKNYPNYKIIQTSSDRLKKYSHSEINLMITLKRKGATDQEIAKQLGRTYWSVVYKISELRKKGYLER